MSPKVEKQPEITATAPEQRKRKRQDKTPKASDSHNVDSVSAAPATPDLPTYEELGITDADVAARLEEFESRWQSGDRLETEAVFVRGEVVAAGRALCDTQELWESWATKRLKVTRRGAENYLRVHATFGPRSKRFIAAGVGATVMYALTAGDEEKIEAVLRHYEAGGTMSGPQVRAFVDGSSAAEIQSEADPVEMGGPEGIRALVKAKLATMLPQLMEHLQRILAAMLVSLDDHHRGARIKKGALAGQIESEARLARAKLENVAYELAPNPDVAAWRLYAVIPSPQSGWGRLSRLLYDLGDRHIWSKDLEQWLVEVVIPAIEWALGAKRTRAIREADAKRLETISAAAAKGANEGKPNSRGGSSRKASKPRKNFGQGTRLQPAIPRGAHAEKCA